MAGKYVYFFGNGQAEGKAEMKNLLGGKGANLAEMTAIGLPVPPGFTITTEVCTYYYANNRSYPPTLAAEVADNLKKVEALMGRTFGDRNNPLLVSVRSGARASMPGMMDTILNLGLNDETVQGIIAQSGDERFAYDAYRRFVQMYSDVVMGMDKDLLEHLLEQKKEEKGVHLDTDLTAADWKELVGKFKAKIRETLGKEFPEDPQEQLWGAVGAVFGSWMNQRAITYRRLNNIPADWGTAVNVQSMVYGNMGNDCATGVAFTRDPSTGENYFYGEYLVNAQGEDVVAGIRTPQPINRANSKDTTLPAMEDVLPECYQQLVQIRGILEKHYRDMQDIEFTIEKGKLFMLQTRNGKRTAKAAIKIAVDMVREGLIDEKTAVLRVSPSQLDQLLHPSLDPKAQKRVIAKGLPASPGAASGEVVFTADEAEAAARLGLKVILVRVETSPEDIHGMHAAQGILTARGGMTSHAAVVARGMGKCCVAGCGDIKVDYAGSQFATAKGQVVKKGDVITLDGSTGEVMLGEVPTVPPQLTGDFGTLMEWVDRFRKLKVRTNADTPNDSRVAREFGAEGIGLCRTEHMFFEADRIAAVREMILAEDVEGRKKALAKILPMQKGDFVGIFREMKGLPVTIRLLDPPLHEFLPHEDKDIDALAKTMGVTPQSLRAKVDYLHEFNPMLGHRGCRLGLTFPEIYDMQVQAIMEAACELTKNEGFSIVPEIMIPLVGVVTELARLRENTVRVCEEVIAAYGVKVEYLIGTMIELPRAALTADEIAREAEFFSFGTNDLTQTTFGLSRDDAGKFLPFYVETGLLEDDPFVSLDQNGVGLLVKMAVEKGRATRPGIKLGICGEHGGDPSSVIFCHQIGLDYVSCSPFRVPIARLAAAHAALEEGK
ncbi:pyruvate, phosphate dikinase [Geobacter sulfurreducens]|jgi:pyruvate,orthophosphate dikinase|uniref:pyruvate, phosphate dikinase n=1 Tax=Geobacter sulfurreducens TaxID=35554 RepID=UPI0001D8F034|nr:pyruvate, phosphate dikinase [Geobacter sulfurreducens]ADI83421.1 pyruvate phosphate dikinase [Geobacter sulfurreducens KN400]AJY70335.1 pyruvate phosphate dikinase [Geobacter sulfurreducens]QVW35827.1 pyruvate, phosphate dikinase [Geobacter sulfurreducens]UTG93283.1 pyruvate, phosphate dikinase [Geobacter sulfurreducens]BBA69119.1 Pyruvate, phosphate dikinase [Geobacter sulfurreducens]